MGLVDRVADHGNRNGLLCDASGEGQGAALRDVVAVCDRRTIESRVDHGNRLIPGRRERDDEVCIRGPRVPLLHLDALDVQYGQGVEITDQRLALGLAQDGSDRRRQVETERLAGIGDPVTFDCDRDGLAGNPGTEAEHAALCHVILAGNRRTVCGRIRDVDSLRTG